MHGTGVGSGNLIIEETRESQGEVHPGKSGRVGGPGYCGMLDSSLPGRAVPLGTGRYGAGYLC